MDVEGAPLSSCVRRRLTLEDDGPDAVHKEPPGPG
jgi:hypothetical protein